MIVKARKTPKVSKVPTWNDLFCSTDVNVPPTIVLQTDEG
jgi:hypothetical protein